MRAEQSGQVSTENIPGFINNIPIRQRALLLIGEKMANVTEPRRDSALQGGEKGVDFVFNLRRIADRRGDLLA